jgi:hypothetical protein
LDDGARSDRKLTFVPWTEGFSMDRGKSNGVEGRKENQSNLMWEEHDKF